MGEYKGYKKLIGWQKADILALDVYKITRKFPKEELYGITSQLRRAALSVPTNLAEGHGRQSKNELRRFVSIALGSLTEVEYLLGFSEKLGFISGDEYSKIEENRHCVGKILYGLYRKL